MRDPGIKFNRKAHKEHGGWGERVGIYNTHTESRYTNNNAHI